MRSKLVAVVIVSLAFVGSSCGSDDVGDDVLEAFDEAADDGGVVDLATVVDRDWEELYVFAPYTQATEVERFIGFRTDRIDDGLALQLGEDENLYVFTDGEEIVDTAIIRRSNLQFTPVRERIDRDDARFAVERLVVEGGVDLLRADLIDGVADPAEG